MPQLFKQQSRQEIVIHEETNPWLKKKRSEHWLMLGIIIWEGDKSAGIFSVPHLDLSDGYEYLHI